MECGVTENMGPNWVEQESRTGKDGPSVFLNSIFTTLFKAEFPGTL